MRDIYQNLSQVHIKAIWITLAEPYEAKNHAQPFLSKIHFRIGRDLQGIYILYEANKDVFVSDSLKRHMLSKLLTSPTNSEIVVFR